MMRNASQAPFYAESVNDTEGEDQSPTGELSLNDDLSRTGETDSDNEILQIASTQRETRVSPSVHVNASESDTPRPVPVSSYEPNPQGQENNQPLAAMLHSTKRRNKNVVKSGSKARGNKIISNESRRHQAKQRPFNSVNGVSRNSIVKKTAAVAQRGKQGRSVGGRGAGFTVTEVGLLLDLIEKYLPIGRDEWETVQRLFVQKYPSEDRSVDSLKRKFAALHRQKTPTGNPHIPPNVLRAKKIREKIKERADMASGEDIEDIGIVEVDENGNTARNRNEGVGAVMENEDEGSQSRRGDIPATVNDLTNARPLVMRRPKGKEAVGGDISEMMKYSIMQDERRRAAEHEQRMIEREEERDRREADRQKYEMERIAARERYEAELKEARERRSEENKRFEASMQMMMIIMAKNNGNQNNGN